MHETAVDALLGGRLRLRQPTVGHRAGTDALLVAAAAGPDPGGIIADVGSGVGTIGLAIALRMPSATIRLIEREPDLAALAAENAALNGVADRVGLTQADVFDKAAFGALRKDCDLVVSNPPFYASGAVRPSPQPLKARAYGLDSTIAATHGGWLRAMIGLLRPHGRVVLIHRPDALPELLAEAHGRLGALRVRPILPREGEGAIRILFGGIVGSRAPFTILAPLVLHAAGGGFTPLAAAIARGDEDLPLFEPQTRKGRSVRPAIASSPPFT